VSFRQLRQHSFDRQAVHAIGSHAARLQSGTTAFGPVKLRYELDRLEYSGPATGTRKAYGKRATTTSSTTTAKALRSRNRRVDALVAYSRQ
jgi:hypothetical protein